MSNLYLPYAMKVSDIKIETEDHNIKTIDLEFLNPEDKKSFKYMPGQFAEFSIYGAGESPFGMASYQKSEDHLKFSINKVGTVTKKIHELEIGTKVGIRGPFGNFYPVEKLKGSNVVIIGGGFAFTTLRALVLYLLDPAHRKDYKNITVIYGARSPGMLLYRHELETWQKRKDINIHLTIDREASDWKGKVGFVPNIVKQVAPSSKDCYAVICGPPIMIKFTLPELLALKFSAERIITSLEMRMKCGIGKCGRCNIGKEYVCVDGPVFTMEQLHTLPDEF